MMKWIVYSLFIVVCFACKSKKNLDSTKAFFSVVGFTGSEIKRMDTLPLTYTKIVTVDSTSDTVRITKEEFHKYAQEFTSITDIASSDEMDDYKEVNDFDETLGNVLLIYTPKKDDADIRNETIMMQADEQGNTHVKTILVTSIQQSKDSTVEKNMTWHVDKRFQVVTKVSKPNQPEKISTVAVQWE